MISQRVRDQILQAAKHRFGYYGFKKTSMVEIAKDCDMSAANIYRHFIGKDDIITALAADVFAEEEKHLLEICNTDFKSASLKLHSFLREALLQTHSFITEKPRMKEMVDYICQEHVSLINDHKAVKLTLIASILQEGISSNEFFIDDIEKTSQTIISATVMFHTPLFFDFFTFEELKTTCTDVVDILLTAITKHPQEPK